MRDPSRFVDSEAIEYVQSLLISNKINDKLPTLGEGLSGKVYGLEDYAVKVYKDDYSENDDYLMLSKLQGHSAFPTLHYREDQFMVVDQVNGFTLAQALHAGEKISESTYEQIERCVEDCYKDGIIARDLHMNNIMLDKDGKVKIIDVGRFFYTNNKEEYFDSIQEDLDNIQYHMGFFSSSSRKKYKRRKYSSSYSSSNHRHRRHYSSSDRHRHYSSSDHRRRYYTSSARHHRSKGILGDVVKAILSSSHRKHHRPHKHKKVSFSWS